MRITDILTKSTWLRNSATDTSWFSGGKMCLEGAIMKIVNPSDPISARKTIEYVERLLLINEIIKRKHGESLAFKFNSFANFEQINDVCKEFDKQWELNSRKTEHEHTKYHSRQHSSQRSIPRRNVRCSRFRKLQPVTN